VSAARVTARLLHGFVALTATGGGVALATGVDPFPLAWLEGTPFGSYLVPGLILAIAVGGSATLASVLLARRHPDAWLAAALAGAALTGWIAIEIAILRQPTTPTHIELLYLALGVAGLLLAPALRSS
jgi:hypothetical protein